MSFLIVQTIKKGSLTHGQSQKLVKVEGLKIVAGKERAIKKDYIGW